MACLMILLRLEVQAEMACLQCRGHAWHPYLPRPSMSATLADIDVGHYGRLGIQVQLNSISVTSTPDPPQAAN